MSNELTYEDWLYGGMELPKEFETWIDQFMPDWALEYSGDTFSMLRAWQAGREFGATQGAGRFDGQVAR